MKFRTPILYDKEGNAIGWLESEIPAETIAQLRWEWAYTLKNCKESWRMPIFEEKDGE
jgi:hypothetical protein